MQPDVIIVGAGLAGLCCALQLRHDGLQVRVIDAADAVGGRIRTDIVDGFRLDRGFQVLLTAYPEAQRMLDMAALDLRAFDPGARIATDDGIETIGDPFRRFVDLWPTLTSRIGSLPDKLRVLLLRQSALGDADTERFAGPDRATIDELRQAGFSADFVEQFFRPFFGGVFLDPDLTTTARMFRFTWRMFATGDAAVPAAGMQAIPEQLAARLPIDALRLGTTVEAVEETTVRLKGGETLSADAVVIATDGASASRLLGEPMPKGVGTTCLYYDAPEPPFPEPRLMLNGTGRGPVNNLSVMSNVAPGYAPAGRALIAATVLGIPDEDDEALDAGARARMRAWFGREVDSWRLLRTYRIPYALPTQPVGALDPPRRPARHPSGLYVCGDHRDNASIQGAMVSGRRVAEALLSDRRSTRITAA